MRVRVRARLVVEILSVGAFGIALWKLLSLPIDGDAFRGLRPRSLVAFALSYGAVTCILAWQWKFIQARLSPVSLRQSFLVLASTIHFSYFPVRGGLILSRMHRARHLSPPIPYAESGASLFVVISLRWGLIFISCLLLPFLYGPERHLIIAPVVLCAGLVLLILLRRPLEALVIRRLLPAAFRRSREEISDQYDQLRENVLRLMRSGRTIALYVATVILNTAISCLVMSLIWRDLGYTVQVHHLMVVVFVSQGVGIASHLPGGIGASEAAYAYLLSLLGTPPGMAVIVGLLWRALIIAFDVGLALVGMILWRLAARRDTPE